MKPILLPTIAVLMLGCASPRLIVEPVDPEPQVQLAGLERFFWACDYVGTNHGVLSAPDACHGIVTELNARKFRGDFEALLRWWRANKPAEHRRLAVQVNL